MFSSSRLQKKQNILRKTYIFQPQAPEKPTFPKETQGFPTNIPKTLRKNKKNKKQSFRDYSGLPPWPSVENFFFFLSFFGISVGKLWFSLGLFGFSIETILGSMFRPLAWSMGIPWSESSAVGSLMGKKIVFTEFVAFADLKSLIDSDLISERAAIIASYALCGFANFGSIGIQLGGIGGIAPKRRKEIAQLIFKAMIGGAIASWLTATLAGILL